MTSTRRVEGRFILAVEHVTKGLRVVRQDDHIFLTGPQRFPHISSSRLLVRNRAREDRPGPDGGSTSHSAGRRRRPGPGGSPPSPRKSSRMNGWVWTWF